MVEMRRDKDQLFTEVSCVISLNSAACVGACHRSLFRRLVTANITADEPDTNDLLYVRLLASFSSRCC